ncbi:MAG: hypothetical protein QOH46_4128 [Solirubrobacteraceae bacterium]|nr:hypothetical protein [Solirubrobacteraceae bacterium]
MLLTGLLLSVVASLALNAGYLLQHLGGAGAPAVQARRPVATLRGLLGSKRWILGTGTALGGSVLHVGALATAPLSLVQAFSAGGLAVVVPIAARVVRTPLQRAEQLGILAILLALGALAIDPVAASHAPVLGPAAIGFFAIILATATVLALTRIGHLAAALAAATGLLYGLSDAATKGFTDAAAHGLAGALLTPWPFIVVALCAAAFFTFQRALQIGAAATVIVVMTATMSATAVLAGVVVLGESFGQSAPVAALHLAAMVAIGFASWRLAGAQARLGAAAVPHPAQPQEPPRGRRRTRHARRTCRTWPLTIKVDSAARELTG